MLIVVLLSLAGIVALAVVFLLFCILDEMIENLTHKSLGFWCGEYYAWINRRGRSLKILLKIISAPCLLIGFVAGVVAVLFILSIVSITVTLAAVCELVEFGELN